MSTVHILEVAIALVYVLSHKHDTHVGHTMNVNINRNYIKGHLRHFVNVTEMRCTYSGVQSTFDVPLRFTTI